MGCESYTQDGFHYLVFDCTDYEGSACLGLFSTRPKAEEFITALQSSPSAEMFDDLIIMETILDPPRERWQCREVIISRAGEVLSVGEPHTFRQLDVGRTMAFIQTVRESHPRHHLRRLGVGTGETAMRVSVPYVNEHEATQKAREVHQWITETNQWDREEERIYL